jgi:hypothetical protein
MRCPGSHWGLNIARRSFSTDSTPLETDRQDEAGTVANLPRRPRDRCQDRDLGGGLLRQGVLPSASSATREASIGRWPARPQGNDPTPSRSQRVASCALVGALAPLPDSLAGPLRFMEPPHHGPSGGPAGHLQPDREPLQLSRM